MGASSSTVSFETINTYRPNELLSHSECNSVYSVWGQRKEIGYPEFCTLFFNQKKVDEDIKKRLWRVFCNGFDEVDLTQFARNVLFLRHGDRACFERLLGDALPPNVDLSTIHWLKQDTIFDSFEQTLTAVTHFSEKDVSSINQFILRNNKPDVLTLQEFTGMIIVPYSDVIKEGLFRVFNVYNRISIAFPEYVAGLSSISRGPETERLRTFCRVWDTNKKGYFDLNDIKVIYHDLNLSEAERTLHKHFDEKITYEEFVIWVLSCPAINNLLLKMLFMIGSVCLGAPVDDYPLAAQFLNAYLFEVEPHEYDDFYILSVDQNRALIEALREGKTFNAKNGGKIFSHMPIFKDYYAQPCFHKNLTLRRDFFPVPTFVWDSVCWWLKIHETPDLQVRSSCHIKALPGDWQDNWYQPKPTTNYFFDIYPVFAALLVLDTSKIVDGKYHRRLERIFAINRLSSVYDAINGYTKENMKQSNFRIRCIAVDEAPRDELITPQTTVADLKCWETVKFLVEDKGTAELWPVYDEAGVIAIPKPKNNNNSQIPHGVNGLINLRRTCYLNCALQMLAASNAMSFLQADEFWRVISSATDDTIRFTLELSRVYCALINDDEPFAPKEFKDIFLRLSGFHDNTENDAHETFELIINEVHNECHKYFEKEQSDLIDKTGETVEEKAEIAWAKNRAEGVSFITNAFEGQMRSELHCSSCNNTSYSFEPFKSFSLPLQDQDITVKIIVGNITQTMFIEKALNVSHDLKLDAFFVRVANQLGVSPEKLFIFAPNANAELQKSLMESPDTHLLRNVISSNEDEALLVYQLPEPYSKLSNELCVVRQRLIRDCRTALIDRIHRYSIMDAGAPFVFKYEEGMTGEKLYKIVLGYFNSIVTEFSSNEQVGMLNRAMYENEKNETYPFYLVYTDPTGLYCPKCHWTKYCIGCELFANDEPISLEFARFVSVQWKFMPYFLKWSGILHYSRMIDPSAQQFFIQRLRLQTIDITECLTNAVAAETLDTKLTCEKCKKNCYFNKKLQFTRIPDSLVLNFKRFMSNNGAFVKNKNNVSFPLYNFDMSPYLVNGIPGENLYDCTGFIIHRGEIHGGHYVSYVKRSSAWYYINDDEVIKVEEKHVELEQAYMILYEKKTAGNIREIESEEEIEIEVEKESEDVPMDIVINDDHVVPTDDGE